MFTEDELKLLDDALDALEAKNKTPKDNLITVSPFSETRERRMDEIKRKEQGILRRRIVMMKAKLYQLSDKVTEKTAIFTSEPC